MVRQISDPLDKLMDYNIDVEKREIYLTEAIEDETAAQFIKGLNFLAKSGKEITVFISCPGGSDYSMFAMYDAMRNCGVPIRTIALGWCMSAAPLLLAAGTLGKRYVGENCSVMIHQSHGEIYGRTIDHKTETKHWDHLEKRWCELMERHTKKDRKFWGKITENVDKFLTAKQAITYGLADYIWGD